MDSKWLIALGIGAYLYMSRKSAPPIPTPRPPMKDRPSPKPPAAVGINTPSAKPTPAPVTCNLQPAYRCDPNYNAYKSLMPSQSVPRGEIAAPMVVHSELEPIGG